MTINPTEDVRALYEAFPYPSPAARGRLILDVANMVSFLLPGETLAGKRILDAGCGTGQRLLALAKKYPLASFWGVDVAFAPLAAARKLAEANEIHNIQFDQFDIGLGAYEQNFDLIVSTGVIHHLPDPAAGLRNLCARLNRGGVIVLWLYHVYGEFDRLLNRELVHTLWDRTAESLEAGLGVLESLNFKLSRERYSGAFANRDNDVMDDLSMNADAYLHPLVNAYRFSDAFRMLAQADLLWAAPHSINIGNGSRLIDLSGVSKGAIATFCLKTGDLFSAPNLHKRFDALPPQQKLNAIELIMKPTGFAILAGNHDSLSNFDARIQGNAVDLNNCSLGVGT